MDTETDIESCLSEDQKREIAEDVFRQRVKEALGNERQGSNFLYDMTQNLVADTLEANLGDWRGKLIEHIKGALKTERMGFYVFRRADPWGNVDGPDIKYMQDAVDKHAGRIETRVLAAIDDMEDMDLGSLLRDALAKRLGGDT